MADGNAGQVEVHHLSIRELTDEAEQGHGCVLGNALSAMGWDTSVRTMREIWKLNGEDREKGLNVPELSLRPHAYGTETYAELDFATAHWNQVFAPLLVKDSVNVGAELGERKVTCDNPDPKDYR